MGTTSCFPRKGFLRPRSAVGCCLRWQALQPGWPAGAHEAVLFCFFIAASAPEFMCPACGRRPLIFSDFSSFGADYQGLNVAVASAALTGDNCSILIQRPGVDEANLPDVLEHWTLREYVELAFLRAARRSRTRHGLQAVLLWMEERESTEAFDFAFGLMEEHLDGLRTLTLKGRPFGVYSFRP